MANVICERRICGTARERLPATRTTDEKIHLVMAKSICQKSMVQGVRHATTAVSKATRVWKFGTSMYELGMVSVRKRGIAVGGGTDRGLKPGEHCWDAGQKRNEDQLQVMRGIISNRSDAKVQTLLAAPRDNVQPAPAARSRSPPRMSPSPRTTDEKIHIIVTDFISHNGSYKAYNSHNHYRDFTTHYPTP
ncbi:hypothetical protein FN846DRAFT_914693 [Sphaerosporella brunnea]|uniref:Uncharacterized protein n=1 Tax=Sphaerosporella brunnea TaxID=1250544 RepID=A0A5J5EBL3_9PEZI|nr:hypothetical protein FN846DRAFT_914693 [Sphaerosporella brunnea]